MKHQVHLDENKSLMYWQNLEEHVECSEQHFPRPEQVEDIGGLLLLLLNHNLTNCCGLQQMVWDFSSVHFCYSLSLNLCLVGITWINWKSNWLITKLRRQPNAQNCLTNLFNVAGPDEPSGGLWHQPPQGQKACNRRLVKLDRFEIIQAQFKGAWQSLIGEAREKKRLVRLHTKDWQVGSHLQSLPVPGDQL